jgi:hypothetical protein
MVVWGENFQKLGVQKIKPIQSGTPWNQEFQYFDQQSVSAPLKISYERNPETQADLSLHEENLRYLFFHLFLKTHFSTFSIQHSP